MCKTAEQNADAHDAVESQPWAATPYLQRGLVAEALGDFTAGRQDFRRAARPEPKNYRPYLLLARVEALVRRRRHGGKRPVLRFGELEVDTARRAVRRAGQLIDLSPRDYNLLYYLALHPDEVVVTCGAKHAIYLALQCLVGPGDAVLLPTPAWVSYGPMIELAGGSVIPLPLHEDDGFVPLFNGHDLTGWVNVNCAPETWSASNHS